MNMIIIKFISSFFNEGKTTSVTSTAFQAGPPYTKNNIIFTYIYIDTVYKQITKIINIGNC